MGRGKGCALVKCECLKLRHLRRAAELDGVFQAPGVLLTTYGMVQHNAELFCSTPGGLEDEAEDEEHPLWDFLILDEVRYLLYSTVMI